MKRLFLGFVCFFFGSQSFGATLNLYKYEVKGYPTSGTRCATVAEAVAKRLSDEAEVEIYHVGCGTGAKGYANFTITYLSEKPLDIVSTYDDNITASIYKGTYSSLQQCQAAMAGEKDRFYEATQLKPIMAYCQLTKDSRNRYPYLARLDAVGTATNLPFTMETLSVHGPKKGERLCESVLTRLKTLGFVPGHCALTTTIIDTAMRVRFYAPKRHYIRGEDYVPTKTVAQCEAQKEKARTIFREAYPNTLATYCWKGNRQGVSALNHVFIHTIDKKAIFPKPFQVKVDPKTYADFSTCTSKIDAVVAFYKEKLKRDVVGALCGYQKDSYAVYIVERNEK